MAIPRQSRIHRTNHCPVQIHELRKTAIVLWQHYSNFGLEQMDTLKHVRHTVPSGRHIADNMGAMVQKGLCYTIRTGSGLALSKLAQAQLYLSRLRLSSKIEPGIAEPRLKLALKLEPRPRFIRYTI